MAVSYSDDEQTYFILYDESRRNARTAAFDLWALAAGPGAAGAFCTSFSGLYMHSQGQQIHLGVADETVFELFERAP